MMYTVCNRHPLVVCGNCFVVITIIHHSTEGVFILCNIRYLLIHSYFIEEQRYSECGESVKRLVPIIALSLNKIQDMICDIPVISDIQKRYYQTIIRTRYEKIFYPVLKKLYGRGFIYHDDSYLGEER